MKIGEGRQQKVAFHLVTSVKNGIRGATQTEAAACTLGTALPAIQSCAEGGWTAQKGAHLYSHSLKWLFRVSNSEALAVETQVGTW